MIANGRSMDAQRWWQPFVEIVTLLWIALFAVDLAIAFDSVAVSEPLAETIRRALRWLLVVFLLDLVLLYRWSDDGPWAFLRSNWFLTLTAVPWFRPLRVLRAGRAARTLRLLVGSRRAASVVAKLRGNVRRLWRRLRDREK